MTYRESARAATPPTLRIYRSGAPVRVFMTLLIGAGIVFFAVMAVLVSHDSFLDCTRSAAGQVACAHEEQYPFGIERRAALPPLVGAHTEGRVSRGRGGARYSTVLVLMQQDGGRQEYPGVGKSGARASQVAALFQGFLAGDGEGSGRWQLREGSMAVAVFLLIAALGIGALLPMAFWTTHISLTPDRQLAVRMNRWPLRAQRYGLPIDRFARVEARLGANAKNPMYSVRVVGDGEEITPIDLGIAYHLQDSAERLAGRLQEEILRWRDA